MNQKLIYSSEDLNDAGSNVLNSILDSRIEQIDAITLPIDIHRKDIIHAIQKIESYPKRLSSFLDYLIDYTYHLNLELSQKQDQLTEALEELALLKKGRKTKSTDGNTSLKLRNFPNTHVAQESDLEESLTNLNKIQKKQNNNLNDDYVASLKKLNAKEGNLFQTLNIIVEENQHLHKINNELTRKVEKSSRPNYYNESSLFANDDSIDSDKKIDITELKDQFNQIETDLIKLRQQVQSKFAEIHPKQ